MIDRKNYSLYMPVDFIEKLDELRDKQGSLRPLSISQAVYLIVSSLAKKTPEELVNLLGKSE